MNKHFGKLVLLATIVLLVQCQSSKNYSKYEGRLFYSSTDSYGYQISFIEFKTGKTTQLTSDTGDSFTPSASADSSMLAFSYEHDIVVLNLRSYQKHILISLNGSVVGPKWSPDGRQIIFTLDEGAVSDIYIVNTDGSSLRSITANTVFQGSARGPSWSPDGKSIAFMCRTKNNWDICTMSAEGSQITRLTTEPGIDGSPSWSPDGLELVFTSDRAGQYDIYLMDSQGANVRRLTYGNQDNKSPAWSPSGEFIAFVSERTGNPELFVMTRKGTDQLQITKNSVADATPFWAH